MHPPVLHYSRYPCHQIIVVHPVEELLQIDVHYPAIPIIDVRQGLTDRLEGSPPGPKPAASIGKTRLEQWRKHLSQRLLDESVCHPRYS
jgi:site-specific DNA recombinase